MPSRSNYICVKCETEMMNRKSGVLVEEHREANLPYKIWEADLRECAKCGFQVLAGFGQRPHVEHFEKEKYTKLLPYVKFHIREIYPIELSPALGEGRGNDNAGND